MKKEIGKFLLLIGIAYLAARSCIKINEVAWGTGVWLGDYSLKWALIFFISISACAAMVIFTGFILWKIEKVQYIFEHLTRLRSKLGGTRWLIALLLLISPVWVLQFTGWGIVFKDISIRGMFWLVTVLGFSFLISHKNIIDWKEFLTATLLTSSEFIIAAAFINVTDYPFSLGWSEGNRMWDYSMLFGRDLYYIPPGQNTDVLLDIGRQVIGGLPFLIPNLTIKMERFWVAATLTFPYILLGFAAFRANRAQPITWALAALWVLIFLKQGPIHPPLVLCAVIVALLWKKPLWIAIPLIAVASYLAWASRFTWLFAPGIWLGMLELAGSALQNKKLDRTAWTRAITLGLVGMAAGWLGPQFINLSPADTITTNPTVSIESASAMASTQPLLWYRLLPNATYGTGILIALLIAVLPMTVIVIRFINTKKWDLNIWQILSIIAPLSAFLAVGLIVSAKIGGGGDLHNMDMFLIGLMFVAALAWHNGGQAWLLDNKASPIWVKILFILSLVIPAVAPLSQLHPIAINGDTQWLLTLTDTRHEETLNLLPKQNIIAADLQTIQQEIALAKQQGDVLFIDQRQLLTFGYIKDVPLIPDYEKKVLMNEALRPNAEYFARFHADIAAQKFTLILSEPLRVPEKDRFYHFGEENNAWVKWISAPVLCYYEEKIFLKEAGVQLLVPISNPADCTEQIPQGNQP